jgi:hypothetical protein
MLNRMLNRNFINYKVCLPDLRSLDPSPLLEKINHYLKVSGSRHPALKDPNLTTIIKYKLLQIFTAPFIYLCFVPTIAMDLIVTLYQRTCFPLYGIPLVKRGEYVVLDRYRLKYLNLAKKSTVSIADTLRE